MTNREKKAYLSRYISAGREIEDLKRERERWREYGESITSNISYEPRTGGVSDKVGVSAANIARIDSELERKLGALVSLRLEIGSHIDTVGDDTLRRVLYLRYVEGNTWEQIAVIMNYTYQWVCVLHGRALSLFKTVDSN